MVGFLSGLFGGGYEQDAAQKDLAAAQAYQGQALPALQQGYQTGVGALNQGIGAFSPLVGLGAQYSQAAPTYLGAMGVGSPEQVAAAQSAFTSSPGYTYQLGQAQQAAERAAAAGGMTNSGNLINAEQQNAVNLANQNYQQWVNNLQSAGQMGLNATQAGAAGTAAGYGGLANLAAQNASNQANVYGNVEQQTIGANNLAAAGQAAGAKNLLGAGLSLATLAMGGGLGGGLGSGLGGMMAGLGGSSAIGGMPATGAGAPSDAVSNAYALSQGINPWA
jgi:hypothetical protein